MGFKDAKETEQKDATRKPAIKFAFGMLRAERVNAKERKGNGSSTMMRGTVVAPMSAE
jgi:hypothetical protein